MGPRRPATVPQWGGHCAAHGGAHGPRGRGGEGGGRGEGGCQKHGGPGAARIPANYAAMAKTSHRPPANLAAPHAAQGEGRDPRARRPGAGCRRQRRRRHLRPFGREPRAGRPQGADLRQRWPPAKSAAASASAHPWPTQPLTATRRARRRRGLRAALHSRRGHTATRSDGKGGAGPHSSGKGAAGDPLGCVAPESSLSSSAPSRATHRRGGEAAATASGAKPQLIASQPGLRRRAGPRRRRAREAGEDCRRQPGGGAEGRAIVRPKQGREGAPPGGRPHGIAVRTTAVGGPAGGPRRTSTQMSPVGGAPAVGRRPGARESACCAAGYRGRARPGRRAAGDRRSAPANLGGR